LVGGSGSTNAARTAGQAPRRAALPVECLEYPGVMSTATRSPAGTISWFAKLSRSFQVRLSSRALRGIRRRQPQKQFRPRLERLEDLTLPSVTNLWTGSGHDGLWTDAKNWSLGVPAAGQDVVITNAGNTTAVTLNSGVTTIDSLTSSINFNLTSGAQLFTAGGGSVATGGVTLSNNAVFSIQGGSVLAFDGGSQSIAGSGTVTFDSNSGNQLDLDGNVTLTIGSGIIVDGDNGAIGTAPNGSGTQSIVNDGIIDADTAGGVIGFFDGSYTNNGTLEATGGGAVLLQNASVTGGTITTDSGHGSAVIQDFSMVSGSTITGEFVAGGPNELNELSDVTIGTGGVLDPSGVAASESVAGGLTVDGTVQIDSGNSLIFLGTTGSSAPDSQMLCGTGSVTFGSTVGNALGLSGNVTLTIGAGITIDGENGAIGESVASGTQTIVNLGLIYASIGGGTLTLDVGNNSGTLVNDGTFGAGLDATLQSTVDDPGFVNFNSATATLSGGNYDVAGTFEFDAADIQTNAANITLATPSSQILDLSGNNALANFSTNASAGVLTLLDGKQLSTAGAFSNQGSVTINNASVFGTTVFGAIGAYTQSGDGAVTTLVSGGVLVARSLSVGSGTTLEGTGIVDCSITNSGAVNPGTSTVPGQISIDGTYSQTATGALNEKLGGTTANTFDQLIVNGAGVALAGTINVSAVNGYSPVIGDAFQIIDYASESGDFATDNGYKLGGGLAIVEDFNPTNLTLEVGYATPVKYRLPSPLIATAGSIQGSQMTAADGIAGTLIPNVSGKSAVTVDTSTDSPVSSPAVSGIGASGTSPSSVSSISLDQVFSNWDSRSPALPTGIEPPNGCTEEVLTWIADMFCQSSCGGQNNQNV
jgi:hypothetical protein